jgi:large subunit ribosomal protein L15
MPHRLRKIRKMRGSRTHGYGRIGQHRDAGSRGCRKVGRHKHLWSLVSNQSEPYFGKHGFHSPQSIHKKEIVINLSRLDEIVPAGKATIDLTQIGCTKLLGTGKITRALTVTVPACSKTAKAKIEKAGGHVNTETEEAETPAAEQ